MKIRFLPMEQEIHINHEATLLKIAEKAGIFIDATCAGAKKCGKCKVKISSGNAGELSPAEQELLLPYEIQQGYRLACCLNVTSDLEVYIPHSQESSTRKKRMTILPESFIPEQKNFELPAYGIAFDIGTTTVVGMLWSFQSNNLVDVETRTNYQSLHGADVISRIQFCSSDPSHLTCMQDKIILCFNDILEDLTMRNEILPEQIREVTIVGNTTMSHLVLGVNPESIARAPFIPVFCDAQKRIAKELGIHVNPKANVHLLPSIAGHVGSDIVAMIVATRLHEAKGSHIAIDIGTNGEVVAIKDGQMLTCSTAAGPAFEGASIHHGMRAASGAIEVVAFSHGYLSIQTIDDTEPIGICGSGLIDAVAVLLDAEVIDMTGRMLSREEALEEGISPKLAVRLTTFEERPAFILAYRADGQHILLTQQDVREVQLAKGAIFAGIQTLMKILGMSESTLDSILLAGAFGNYIDKRSALRIGLLPAVSEKKIVPVGNAAGAGASMALLSTETRTLASKIAQEITHVELSLNKDFQDFYMYAMMFE